MKFLISAFTLGIFFAHPVAAVTSSGMNDHSWTRQAHVEDVSGSRGASKDHSRARK